MRRPDAALEDGFAAQAVVRDLLELLPARDRRQSLERRALALARRLSAEHPAYARHYRGAADRALATLPALDKAALLEDADAFLSASGVSRRRAEAFLAAPFELGSRLDAERLLFSTSGSTGPRLPVVYSLGDLGRSLEAFRHRAIASARPQASRLLYIGPLDRHNGGNAWMHHLGGWLDVRLVDLSAHTVEHARALADHQPDVVLTRPSVLEALGRSGERLPDAHLISVGEPLDAACAAEIERAWGRLPHNSYSTVETGPIAYQDDPADPVLSVYDDLSLVEILGEDGRPVSTPGVPGRVAVTTLYRSSYPLVRYAMGDIASWADEALTRISPPTRWADGRGRLGYRGRVPSKDGTRRRCEPPASSRN